MGRKSVMPSFNMFPSGNNSLAGNLTSEIVSVKNLDYASIHVEWSGTSPVGVITVEAKNGDFDDWYTLDMGAPITLSGNSGSHHIIFNLLHFTDIRLQYASTSGTGTIEAVISMKVSGS